MKEMLKNNIKYIIFLAICGLIGGYFTGIYTVQSTPEELIDEALAELGSIEVLYIVITLQGLFYAVVLGVIGKILAIKIGLWRKIEFSKKAIIEILLVTLFGGIIFVMADHLLFNNFSEVVKNSYLVKPTLEYIIASITYGGVVEEVMLRLFFMSLIAWIIQKISKQDKINDSILVVANIISAFLFAVGHLPATVLMIGITPMIILRCLVMNGGFGLMFGRLYRKYGIHCAMLGHAGVHIVSKLIWILFI